MAAKVVCFHLFASRTLDKKPRISEMQAKGRVCESRIFALSPWHATIWLRRASLISPRTTHWLVNGQAWALSFCIDVCYRTNLARRVVCIAVQSTDLYPQKGISQGAAASSAKALLWPLASLKFFDSSLGRRSTQSRQTGCVKQSRHSVL